MIVGAGPAGLTAGIYAARRKLKTLVVSMDVGGQASLTNEVENYPGFDFTTGFDLMNKFKGQAEKWGVEFLINEVEKIEKKGSLFIVKTNNQQYTAQAVLLAFGLSPRKLGVKGENKFKGRGVSYCATCDGPLFKNKIVGVVGGGNSGFETSEYMSKIAKEVYLIHISDEFTAVPYLIDRVKKIKNIKFYCCSAVKEIKGQKLVSSVVLSNVKDMGQIEELKLDGVFVEIGYEAKTQWLKGLVKLNREGEIKIGRDCETSLLGVFAAGDCSDISYKQIVISAGEGAKAALQVYKYIVQHNRKNAGLDWGKCELVGTTKTKKFKV
ncbi:MAG TPA: thioredoxin-disulfide reductase [Patescibacteria group bacterium]|nr:thioredoxin-disulfide reductase [Patescibacteria group bacterium]